MSATDVRPAEPAPRPPGPGPLRRGARRAGDQLTRFVMLLLLLLVSGIAIGLVFAYPVSLIKFGGGGAVRLDQASLAGQTEADAGLVQAADLPPGWVPGDPNLKVFGVLGSEFCGDRVELPSPLSNQKAAVFTNPGSEATVIAQVLRTERWQAARDYVASVDDARGQCSEFFQSSPLGRVKSSVEAGSGSPPITDYASGAYVAKEGRSVSEWSMMAVGDLIVAITYAGPSRTSRTFLNQLEARVLSRLDPANFAPEGVGSTTSVPGATTLPGGSEPPVTAAPTGGGGSADESGGSGGP
ncbi:MAG: hypothetical protein ACOYOP_01400 [Microthrixaceae bacterium]